MGEMFDIICHGREKSKMQNIEIKRGCAEELINEKQKIWENMCEIENAQTIFFSNIKILVKKN